MSSLTTSEWIRYTVLPVVIGLVSGVLSAFVSWVVEQTKKRQANRELQLKTAIDICKKVIDSMDSLYAKMRNDAWFLAWRKARNLSLYSGELVEVDKQKWAAYNECLDEWRTHTIGYETDLRGAFGEKGYEAYLFLKISALIDQAASHLWKIYYSLEGHEGDKDRVLPVWREGKPVLENLDLDKSQSGQIKSMEEYFDILDQMKGHITTLSSTMIHCIQAHNVGNMKTSVAPVPETEMEEAMVMLVDESATPLDDSKKEAKPLLADESVTAVTEV